MDKKVVVHIYNGILLSHKTECIWVSSNWVEVDGHRDCHAEWSKSERERQISYINRYMVSRKMVLMILFTGQQRKLRHKEQNFGHRGKDKGWMTWESNIETYITICKIDSQWEFAPWFREPKASYLWQTRGGGQWGRWEKSLKGRGHCVCLWLIQVDVWQKPRHHCKVTIFQLKWNILKKSGKK